MKSSTCCVPACPGQHHVLHRFPKPDKKRAWKLLVFKIWLFRACHRLVKDKLTIDEVVKDYRICDIHFSDFCKLPPNNKLRRGSLPTLFLPNFFGESNETNAQIAKLQYCTDSQEIKMFKVSSKTSKGKQSKIQTQVSSSQPETVKEKISTEPEVPSLQKPYFKSVKIYFSNDKQLTEVCRICFCGIKGENVSLNESLENNLVKPKDMLKEVLPDLDLDIYQNCMICSKCSELLLSSFKLKMVWLATEEKLRKIVENERNNNRNKINSNLVLIAETADCNLISRPNIQLDHDYIHKDTTRPEKDITIEHFEVEESNVKSNTDDDSEVVPSKTENEQEAKSFQCLLNRRKREKNGPFLCEQCGRILSQKSSLDRHLCLHKKQLEQERESMCEFCGEIFNSIPTLKKHLQRKHRRGTKTYRCELCNKILYNKRSLRVHVRHLHLKMYNYVQCHLCGKKLTSNSALGSHLKIHTAQKRYACEICDKRFFWLPRLKNHQLKHVDTKLACEICGRTIKYERALKQHIKIFHKGEGKTNCEFCERPYWKKCDLIRHKIKVHGWGPDKVELSK